MKNSLLSFVLVLLVAAPLSALNGTMARAATTNTAVRGQSATTVYWYANDGKRYVFPNAATYFTWFPSFDSVQTISDAELIAIPLGGNVTYRPGAKLVKVNTDPKVYAVARGGVLRHVTSESLASQLYGSNWRYDVHDIPDVYFTNYTVGTPIYSVWDYNVSDEYKGITPSDSLRTNGTTNQTGELVLNTSRTSINAGDAVTLTVSNLSSYGSNYRVEIYDTRTNNLVRTCYLTSSTCEVTVYPQRNNNENSVQYYAALRDSNSNTVKSGYSQVIYLDGVNNGGNTNTGSRFTTTVSRTSINSGESVTLTANLFSNYGVSGSYRVEIRDPRNGSTVQTCWNTGYCSVTTNVTKYDGNTNVTFQARLIVGNAVGKGSSLIFTDSFPTLSFGTGSNGAFSSGSSRLDANRTTVNSGETVTLTATAWNLNTSESYIRMELYRENTNTLIDTCYDHATCTFTRTVTNDGSNSVRYYVLVKNDANEQIPAAYSPRITVSGGTTNNDGTLSLWTSKSSINSGESMTVSAWSSDVSNANRIEVYDERDGSLVFTCYSVQNCSQSRTFTRRYSSENSFRLYAQLKNSSGAVLRTAYTSTISFMGTNQGGQVTLNASRTSVMNGDTITLTAYGSLASGNYRLNIINQETGALVASCYNVSTCSQTVTVYGTNGQSIRYSVDLLDSVGFVIEGDDVTVYVTSSGSSSNDGTNYINGLVLKTDRTSINAGERVTLTANAFNAGNWNYTGNRIEIVDIRTNNIVKTCYDQSWCMVDVYPQAYSSTNLTAQYQARIYDRNGGFVMSQYGPVIYLSSYNGSTGSTDNATGAITFAPTNALHPNQNVYLTATFTGSNIALNDAQVRIYTEQSSTPIATCNGAYTCAVSYPTGPSPMNTRIYAQLSNRYNVGTYAETPRVNFTTTW